MSVRSGQIVVIFLALAAGLFVAGVTYNIFHLRRLHGVPVTTMKTAEAPAPAVPAPPPPPTAPATTVKPVKDALKAGVLNPIFFVQSKMQLLQRGLVAALNSRHIMLEDLDKLDFNPAATTDPYNVFNPNGKIRYTPLDGSWIDQSLVDKLTTKKGTPLIFNMRRTVDDTGGISEVLYAVIPNIASANCGVKAGNQEFSTSTPLSVENDPHTIVDDPAGMPIIPVGCIHTPAGSLWLYELKLRYKHKGQTRWGSH